VEPSQAGDDWAEEVLQAQGRVLIVEQLPITSPIAFRAVRVQMGEERTKEAKVFKPLQVLLSEPSVRRRHYASTPPRWSRRVSDPPPGYLCRPPPSGQNSCRPVLGGTHPRDSVGSRPNRTVNLSVLRSVRASVGVGRAGG
jgi:hypothetical protein